MKKIKYLFCFILGFLLALTINIVRASISSNGILYNGSTVKEALDELYEKTATLSDKVALGDYISMTPTSTSFTTDTSITGYTSSETLNPSELNLWRVIKINDDGTIDVVSEYVSSVDISFRGQTGYQNLVGYLNVIASQYTNTKYVKSTRIMGYNGQTEYITDTSKITSTTAPWTNSTGSVTVESLGGGDKNTDTDRILITNSLGTLVANKVGTTSATAYWLGSRYYYYGSSTYWDFRAWYVNTTGGIYAPYYLLFYSSGYHSESMKRSIRPILTLKSGLSVTGSGTSTDPYVLP